MDDGPMRQETMKPMAFFWGKNMEMLFAGWPHNNLGMYVLALFFVLFLALAVEILSVSPALKPGMSPTVAGITHAGAHALRMSLAYLVMLSVMSYNAGIFLVTIAGHALGFFLIKRRLAVRAQAMAHEGHIPSNTLSPKV
ncbi:hypothetical protein HHK36_016325 [Tetracentron sinense]|uniref:Copper transport protein n=1 Tax=Tetracentron sinense TaxID=13715 RepID=A0A834YWZ4_TETSI|nr:hypothetical protein HHK36_016325 [Tetracentron sinense]